MAGRDSELGASSFAGVALAVGEGLLRQAETQLQGAEEEFFGRRLNPGLVGARYRLLEQLGSGAQGSVWLARDQRLGRRVAIKFSRRRPGLARDWAQSIADEARTLARFQHPNIVQVFAAGVHRESVYVVMEHVAGATLETWVSERSRSRRELFDVFAQVGRGLQAAHDVGVLHRDIKPSNILIASDGRVRIADFGLATLSEAVATAEDSGDPATRTFGALVGTPAYMAPEQLANAAATPASDQYAFAMTMYEALHGALPFAGRAGGSILRQKRAGIRVTSRGPLVSRATAAALERALRPRPEERYPSVRALTNAVASDGMPVVPLVGGAALLTITAAALAWEEPCPESDELGEAWSDDRAEKIRAAFGRARSSGASESAELVITKLDAYASRWADDRRAICQGTFGADWSQREADSVALCYERARGDLDALVSLLEEANAAETHEGVTAVESLPRLDECSTNRNTRVASTPPRTIAKQVARGEAELQRAVALARVGRFAESLQAAQVVRRQADALQYDPLRAKAALHVGATALRMGDLQRAQSALQQAHVLGTEHGLTAVAASAATAMAMAVGHERGDTNAANRWIKEALALAHRLDDPALAMKAIHARGGIAYSASDYERAVEDFAQSFRIAEELHANLEAARALNALAVAELAIGEHDAATEHGTEALERMRAELGRRHPSVASVLHTIGVTHAQRGDPDAAAAFFLESLDVAEDALGPDHPALAKPLGSLGLVALSKGSPAQARDYLRRAVTIRDAAGSTETATYAQLLGNLAEALEKSGDLNEARQIAEKAMVQFQEVSGPGHANVAHLHMRLGRIAQRGGNLEAAKRHFGEAAEVYNENFGADDERAVEATASFERARRNATGTAPTRADGLP